MAARSLHTKGNQEKGSTLPHCSMDPTLALSLLSDNNATQAQKQPVNRQPATNIPPTTAYQTTMDRDLARSLLQNNTPSVPKPTHPKPTQPSKPNQTRNPSTTPGCPAPPPLPPFPPFPPRTPTSRTHQKLLKKLYPHPGVQPRDYTDVVFHPALGYAAFHPWKNPRGLPYPWCEICRGDCWCVDRNVI